MLSRTHGQPATPTTLGKEMAVFVHRLRRQLAHIEKQEYMGKMNGADRRVQCPCCCLSRMWIGRLIAQEFVEEQLGLTYNPLTTQIEPHDWIAELFHSLMRFQTILAGLRARHMDVYLARLPETARRGGRNGQFHHAAQGKPD